MAKDGIGAAVLRKEDRRFLTGAGHYTDDISRPNQAYMAILRSPHAHARIDAVRADAARSAPGVLAVLTGADLAAEKVGNLPTGWLIHSKDGSPMVEPAHPALAQGFARHAGDPVAMVIAETRDQAREAAALVEVDYEELPAVVSVVDAIKPGAPLVHDAAKNNTCYDWHLGDKAATDAAFAKAHKVVTLDLVNNRLIPNAIEPRSAIGEFDRATGDTTLFTTSQNPHLTRLLLGAFSYGIPEHKLRVVAPDVGGGFGSKIYHYAEEFLVLWAARKLGRPVRWTAQRSESFLSDAHGRDHVSRGELAVDGDGNFLGLRVSTLANMGAYLSTFGPAPGSVEGLLYTLIPIADQLTGLVEVVAQALLLSIVLCYWVSHPKKRWLSLVLGAAFCVLALVLYPGNTPLLVMSIVAFLFVIWRHRSNIGRLVRGEEPRIGKGGLALTKKADGEGE